MVHTSKAASPELCKFRCSAAAGIVDVDAADPSMLDTIADAFTDELVLGEFVMLMKTHVSRV